MARLRPLTPLFLLLASCKALSSGAEALGIGVAENEATVVFHSAAGTELGVSTDYGLVFLAQGGRSGQVEWTAWFSDGPSREIGMIEAIGGGLYTVASEIRLPSVPLTFHAPDPGSTVTIVGRRGPETWESEARIVRHPQVAGLLLDPDIEGDLDEGQVGAGVYVERQDQRHLLGLISGRLRLTAGGRTTEYLTVVGPEGLWRLVTYARNMHLPERRVYREDVL